MSTLTQGGIVFGNGQLLTKDPMRTMTEYLGISNRTLQGGWIHTAYLAGRNARGTYYNDRHTTSTDVYGNVTGYTNAGYNRIEVTNYTDTTLRINLIGGIFSSTDDYWQYLVYRDGSPSGVSTHVGGAQVINSGQQIGNGGNRTTTIQQDIAPNTTTAFWLYATIFNGSGGDQVGPYLASTFNSWV